MEKTDISDMFEQYAVQLGGYSYQQPWGTGHGSNYWDKQGCILAVEAFAEMTSASITNPKSLTQIKKYLPNAYAAYLDILRGMV